MCSRFLIIQQMCISWGKKIAILCIPSKSVGMLSRVFIGRSIWLLIGWISGGLLIGLIVWGLLIGLIVWGLLIGWIVWGLLIGWIVWGLLIGWIGGRLLIAWISGGLLIGWIVWGLLIGWIGGGLLIGWIGWVFVDSSFLVGRRFWFLSKRELTLHYIVKNYLLVFAEKGTTQKQFF